MPRYLCIQVTFLDSYYHGQPEWPPSPLRLFQALLAGSRTGGNGRRWTDRTAAAFRWLERQSAPVILAPCAAPAPPYTLFVPNNDADKKFARQERLSSKHFRPQRLPEDQRTIYYLWPLAHPDEDEDPARTLCMHARFILALGRGIDQVAAAGRLLDDHDLEALPAALERWRPLDDALPGLPAWRIPVTGSLEALEQTYDQFAHRVSGNEYNPPANFTAFDRVSYVTMNSLPPRSYVAFEFPDGVSFSATRVTEVSAMVRSLAIRQARKHPDAFPSTSDPEVYVAGHVPTGCVKTPPRFSYLPLPSIGHQHADGRIRRVLIAEHPGGNGSFARWAERALRGQPLIDEHDNHLGRLLLADTPASRRMVTRYIDPQATLSSNDGGQTFTAWASVTPVLLPGFDRMRRNSGGHRFSPEKAYRLVLKAVAQAGLPPELVQDITLRKAPFWPGALHPGQYFRPAELRKWPAWHVLLRLKGSVRGPLAIGAGRHRGLGLLAPVPTSVSTRSAEE